MKLTIKLKLFTNPESEKSLLDTRAVFVDVLNYVSVIVFREKLFNKISLQKQFYYEVKARFPTLNSQLLIQAIRVCVSSYKHKSTRGRLHVFRKYNSVVYDARLLSYNKTKDLVSIATVNGRIKIPLHLNPYFVDKMQFIRGEADLVLRKGNWYLNQVIDIPDVIVTEQVNNIGIDLGIVNIAVDSIGNFYNEPLIERHRQKLLVLKSALQSCGSRSAKRHLKKLSGIESKFRKDINHVISKRIVSLAKDTHSNIKLENLTNIRKSTTVRKKDRAKSSSWSFYQLREFITYKSKMSGIKVIAVNPKNTSRECSACGYIDKANRKSQSKFLCLKCGFESNADFNAAKVISGRSALSTKVGFDQPIVTRNLELQSPCFSKG